ncbi:hypothetical protein I7I51_03072 [Histoplasma capsulatum]|uniref:Uncharacterized protein n=1 Tax=Ajellomyces capsulatus TaxID=5037 RepID=A0A8A1MNR1_AJECA|nr:predicted protein [Histoplasma mississippiense (nom. inval.)]EDN11224.1 predicted protein [Histoplasma mississippiense (nom. inval.)]QSS66860.1 hypothetical protein I7I51_03072 [Histoplasma capsulatum]
MSSRSKSIGQSIGAAHQAQRIGMDDSDIPSQLSLFILFSSAHIIFFANIGLDRILVLVFCVHPRQVPTRQETYLIRKNISLHIFDAGIKSK